MRHMEKLREILTVLALPGMGKVSFHQRYRAAGGVSGLEELTELVQEQSPGRYDVRQIQQAWNRTGRFLETLREHPEVTVLTFPDAPYPSSLRSMGRSAPPVLFLRGDPAVLSLPTLGMVGTRHPSPLTVQHGPRMVQRIQERSPRVIVSGLALGCDGIAHESAVDAGLKTVAALPGGVRNILPSSHRGLADHILETGGCLVSEYGLDAGAERFTYVERDGVIAGLSVGLLVLECGIRSGTMYTAEAARQLGRPLACFLPRTIPGSGFEGNRFLTDTKGALAIRDHRELALFLDRLNGTAGHPAPGSPLSPVPRGVPAGDGLLSGDRSRTASGKPRPEEPVSPSDGPWGQMSLPGFDGLPAADRFRV